VFVRHWRSTVNISGGSLNLHNVIYEAMNSFHIGAHAGSGAESSGVQVVSIWNGGLDDGLNGAVSTAWRMNFFDIAPNAKGSLLVKDQVFSRGASYGADQPASFVWRTINEEMQENLVGFEVTLSGVTLRDWSWLSDDRGYFPPARGVPVELRNCIVNSWSMPGGGGPAGNNPVLETQSTVHPGTTNLLAYVVDTTCGSLTRAQNNFAPSGGWVAAYGNVTAATENTTSSVDTAPSNAFFAVTEKLPKLVAGRAQTLLDGPAVAALRLCSSASSSAAFGVITPRIRVTAGKSYVLSGWLRVAQASGNVNISAEYYQWSPSTTTVTAQVAPPPARSSVARSRTLMHTPARVFGLTGKFQWEPLLLLVSTPADAGSMTLRITVDPGAVMDFFALSLR
jgi:hypothetical protein